MLNALAKRLAALEARIGATRGKEPYEIEAWAEENGRDPYCISTALDYSAAMGDRLAPPPRGFLVLLLGGDDDTRAAVEFRRAQEPAR